jgi:hypothetical protein
MNFKTFFLILGLMLGLGIASVRIRNIHKTLNTKISDDLASPPTFKSDALDTMPVKLGAKRVAFQLNTLLPQVNLTLISVLQGVALGVLVSQFTVVSPLSFPEILLYLDSLILIAVIWHLYAAAFISFVWPFSALQTLLQFLPAAIESFALAFLSQPSVWTLGIAGVAFLGALIRGLNTKIVSPTNYEREEFFNYDMKLETRGMFLLAFIGFSTLVLGIWLRIAEIQQHSYLYYLTAAVGLIVGALLLLTLWEADRASPFEIFFKNSAWEFKHHQLSERKTE